MFKNNYGRVSSEEGSAGSVGGMYRRQVFYFFVLLASLTIMPLGAMASYSAASAGCSCAL